MKEIVIVCSGSAARPGEDRLIGWQDRDLSEEGYLLARKAAEALLREGYTFDVAFTSVLRRAIQTLWEILARMDLYWIKENKNWRLNGRYYGKLEGMTHQEVVRAYGTEKFESWMRDYRAFVPCVPLEDPAHPSHDPRYWDLIPEEIPCGENLVETFSRVFPHWENKIAPAVEFGRKVLIVSHYNSTRALMSMIEGIPIEQIVQHPVRRGVPVVYRLHEDLRFESRKELL